MTAQSNLPPATDEEIIDTLAFGLRFNGRRRVDRPGPLIARIAVEHLVRHLKQCGYAVMKGHGAQPPKAPDGRAV